MWKWLHHIFRTDKVSDGIRKDIAATIKLLYGDVWQNKIKLHKLKGILFDKSYLREYDKLMQDYLAQSFEGLTNEIIKNIEGLSNIRTDAAENNIEPNTQIGNGFIAQVDAYAESSNEILSTFSIAIKEIGKSMLDKNNNTFASQLRDAFGFTPDFENDPVYSHLNSWVDENVNLIKNVDTLTNTRLKSIISENFRNGGRVKNMIKNIKETGDYKEYRLRLIARDQTAKLHGQITKRQQTSIGITKYIWRGVADERERQTHLTRNNKEYKWGEGIEPGQEFQCRCTAEPVINFDDILNSF